MSGTHQSFLRRVTGLLGTFQKRRLWKKGFDESLASDQWTAGQIREYHDRQLVSMVRFAATRIPFYRDLYARARVDIETFRGTADMHRLPPVSKADVLQSLDKMVTPGTSELRMVRHTTGGSTGTIATIVSPRGMASWESGCIYAMWQRIGVRPMQRTVTLRGAVIDDGSKISELDKSENRLTISTYHLNDQNVKQIIELIDGYRPDWLHVYPSAASLFATVLQRTGLRLARPPKGILCGSEKVYPWQLDLFKEVFGCCVYSHYGHGEMALLGGWCEGTQMFHFLPNHGYLELLDDNLQIVTEPGVAAELTGTGYFNRVMPLIRYRTADYGAWDVPGPCPACGRQQQRLASIDGRIQEYLILADGTRFPATNINALHGTFFSYIYRFQFVQDAPGKAVLRFMPAVEMNDARLAEIREAFAYLEGIGLKLEYQSVPDIPLTRSGKQRIVIASEGSGA